MEYRRRYSSWPVRTLKSCLEALENPVLEVPARHGSRGSNSSFRSPSLPPRPAAASTLWYPPFATLNRCHQSTELPHPYISSRHSVDAPRRFSSDLLSFPLHASVTVLWVSTKFRFSFLSLSLSHFPCVYTFFLFSRSTATNTLWTPSPSLAAQKGYDPRHFRRHFLPPCKATA